MWLKEEQQRDLGLENHTQIGKFGNELDMIAITRDNVRFSQMPTSPKFHYFGFAYVNAKIVIRTVYVKAIDRVLYGTKIFAAYG